MDAECPVDNHERVERVRQHFHACLQLYPNQKGMESVKQTIIFFLFCRFKKKCYLIIASEDFSSQFTRNRSFRTIPNQRIKNFYAVRHVYDPDGNLIRVERVTEKSTAELANGKKFHRSL
jgi:hypothetical protein